MLQQAVVEEFIYENVCVLAIKISNF